MMASAATNVAQQNPVTITPEFYESLGADYESAFGHDVGVHRFLEKVLTLLPPSSKVLDLGCGTGSPVSKTLASNGHKVTGIDIAPSMVKLSRKAVPTGVFEVADMTDYIPKEKMHAAFNVLSLFLLSREGMENMSKKWAEWLLPDGFVCICTVDPEKYHPTKEMYDEDGMCVRDLKFVFMGRETWLTLMTKDGWKRLLEGVGFEIIEIMEDYFEPKADSDAEYHYFIIARKTR